MTTSKSPLPRLLAARGIRRIELAAASGVGCKTIARICQGDIEAMRMGTLCRVARALGVAPADLAPQLATPQQTRRPDAAGHPSLRSRAFRSP